MGPAPHMLTRAIGALEPLEQVDTRIDTRRQYNIDPLENKGRYDVARIVRPDGSAIRRLLVDKQTGEVQFAGR